jgi:hypothetical protein
MIFSLYFSILITLFYNLKKFKLLFSYKIIPKILT